MPVPIEAPGKVQTFLLERGWMEHVNGRWTHPVEGAGTMTWEQAMTIEFLNFLMLGRD